MNKHALYAYLHEQKINYIAIEHSPLFTVEEVEQLCLPNPEAGAKNLFLRDDKKRNYYLLTVRDALPVDLKHFQALIGSRRLSFASEEDLTSFLKLKKGAVTPFGILNDETPTVQVYIDAYFENKEISVHPNENNATVYLAANDLVELLKVHGNRVEYIELE